MKIAMSFFFLCFLTFSLQAQGFEIKGTVQDENGSNLPFANVFFFQDTAMIQGRITDENGAFNVQLTQGNYQLKITFVGYEDYQQEISVTQNQSLSPIGLAPSSMQLNEVMVTEFRNEMSAGIDKKVIYVTDELKKFNTNLSEILEMVPIVNMDIDGNPTIPGKGEVIILVDGREPRMRANDLATVLKLIPSDRIVKIEIMTNPPAKYTKSNAAVINVVTNRQPQKGSVFNAHSSVDNLGAAGAGGNYTMKQNRFSLSAWTGRWAWRSESESEIERTNFTVEDLYRYQEFANSEYNGFGYYGGISPEYQIDDKNTISIYGGGFNWNNHNDYNNQVTLFNSSGVEQSAFQRKDYSYFGGGGVFGGIEYFRTFDEKEKEFNVEFGVDVPNRTVLHTGEIIGDQPFYREVKEYEIGWNLDFEIEYFEPLDSTSSLNIELEVQKELPFDVTLENWDGPSETETSLVESLSYDNTLEELSQELSVTYSKKIKDVSVNLDVGQEFIQYNYQFDRAEPVDRDFLFVVPRLTLAYNPENAGEIGLTYRYGATAPRRWAMNPNIIISADGLSERFGNTDLDPERSHDVELNYGFYLGKFNIGASAFWRHSNNAISRFIRVTPEGVQQSTFANNGEFTRSGGAVTLSGTIKKKARINFNASVFDSRIKQGDGSDLETLSYETGLNVTYFLPKDFTVNLSGSYSGPELMIQGEQSGFYQVRGSLRKSFWGGKLNASLYFNDLFRSINETTERSGEGFAVFEEMVRRPAFVGLRLNVRFGELKDMPKSSKARENNRG